MSDVVYSNRSVKPLIVYFEVWADVSWLAELLSQVGQLGQLCINQRNTLQVIC